MWSNYKRQPSFVLGFHGCDESVGEEVLAGRKSLVESKNDYDWLGHGIYFWESNPRRALQFAEEAAHKNKKVSKGSITTPFVIGAVIDLGNCLNLQDSDALSELITANDALISFFEAVGTPPPQNKGGTDLFLRHLDCAVINVVHELRKHHGMPRYDTVRCAFNEGNKLYPGAGFSEKSHIQIAVTNPAMIRGYFRPIKSK